MEVGDKLKELNITADEVDRFTKAFKDEKFREMLRDYAQEISDPENRKTYEEEIKLLEEERGNSIEFIHPKPFRAVKTSVDGKQKCFINICANDKVGKPESKCAVSEDGRRGQCWSLPHSLHPGRQDTDPKGNKIIIYDVIFHPDTLHIASKNKRFMDMVDSTAIQGIQDAFKVTLDKNNVKEMRTKYKGTPEACVIRKPIPGYEAKKPSEQPDPLAFPYSDEKRPTTLPTVSPATNRSDDQPKSFLMQPQKTKEPTKPKYAVKYRSFIDLQDFRCSRDSAQSPRPKEIVVTIDMPLLKSISDTCLEVNEKRLTLESKKPAYRLELPLAYPVDEDKGEAKFNKQRGQLTVTLPVLPPNSDCFAGLATTVGDGESQEEGGVEEEDNWNETAREGKKREQEQQADVEKGREERQIREQDRKQETRAERGGGQEEGEERMREGERSEEEGKEQKQASKEVGQLTRQDRQNEDQELRKYDKPRGNGCDRAAEDSGVTGFQCDTPVQERGLPAEEENSVSSPGFENQHILISAEHSCGKREEEEVNLTSRLESTPQSKPSDIHEETEQTKEPVQGRTQVGTDTSGEESQITAAVSSMPAADFGEREERDNDDLTRKQIFQTSEQDSKPAPVLLREVDKDGNETVISDHSTAAGFNFESNLMFELD